MFHLSRIIALEQETLAQLEEFAFGSDIAPKKDNTLVPDTKAEKPEKIEAPPPDTNDEKPAIAPDNKGENPKEDKTVAPDNGDDNPKKDDTLVPEAKGEDVVDKVLDLIEKSNIFPPDHGFMKRCAFSESHFGTFKDKYTDTFRKGYHGGIWQVDEKGGFKDSKENHSSLKRKHAAIKEKFGIDWMNVKYEDLRKPLYSGLAARLYLSNKPEFIPEKLEDQAVLYKNYYNSGDGAGSVNKFIEDSKIMEARIAKKSKASKTTLNVPCDEN